MGLRKILDNFEHHFQEGGRFQKYYALYEVFDTFLYAPDSVTKSTAHVRDGVDLKRIMITVWLAAFPAMFYGMYNLGFQATDVLAAGQGVEGWRGWLIELLGGYDASSIWDCFWYGAVFFLPIYIVTFLVGITWEIIFALRRGHEILDFCGAGQERYRDVATYSTGMRQKIKFAAAIVHDPEFLILDEPTSGLDPEEREALLARIRLLWEDSGKSVMISTHILPDVQAICDDVVILSKGKVRLNDQLVNLNRTNSPSFSIQVMGDRENLIRTLNAQGLETQISEGNFIVVESPREDLADVIWQSAKSSDVVIQSLIPAKNSLEEIFMSTVREAQNADS